MDKTKTLVPEELLFWWEERIIPEVSTGNTDVDGDGWCHGENKAAEAGGETGQGGL